MACFSRDVAAPVRQRFGPAHLECMTVLQLVADTATTLGLNADDYAEWQRLQTLVDHAYANDRVPDMSVHDCSRYGRLAEQIDDHAQKRQDPFVFANFPDCPECGLAWGSAETCGVCLDAHGEPRRLWHRLGTILSRHCTPAPHTRQS